MSLGALDPEHCWHALCAREARSDFVYAVLTTGIFCRPGCPSRRPRREHVLFLADAAAALAAGFRPCRRCAPQGAGAPAWFAQACRLLETEPELDLDAVARRCGVGRSTLHRSFRRHLGLAPGAWRRAAAARRLGTALGAERTVSGAIERAGYRQPSTAYGAGRVRLGAGPRALRDGGGGLALTWARAATSLGAVVVAWTDEGLCLLEFLEDGEEPAGRILGRWPAARLRPAAPDDAARIAAVVAALEEPRTAAPLPLAVRGTAFQERVWAVLRGLRPGERISYGELARRTGDPRAVRAVARACGENPLAVLVPCHRVVGSDGALRGYRWGLERKRRLLAREAAEGGGPAEAPKRRRARRGAS